MIRIVLVIIVLFVIPLSCFAQSSLHFEGIFQKAYNSIDSDSILSVKQGSTFGKDVAVLCWKSGGKFYFKKIEEKRSRIKTTAQINHKLKKHFIAFYALQLSEDSKECKFYLVDDGTYTFVQFKANDKVVRFTHPSYEGGDESVRRWTQETVFLLSK